MTLVEKCARELAIELAASDNLYHRDIVYSQILKAFAPVVDAQEKANVALHLSANHDSTAWIESRKALAALEADK